MEFLRRKIIFVLLVLVSFSGWAQVNQELLEDAFSKSYASEKNGDFKACLLRVLSQ